MSIHPSLSVPAVCPYSICERVLGNRFTNGWLWKPNYASDDLGQVWYGTGIHKPSIETTPYSKRTEKEGNTLGSALLHADTRTVRKQDCTQSIGKNNNSLFFTIFLNKRKTLEWFFSDSIKSQILMDCVKQWQASWRGTKVHWKNTCCYSQYICILC